jgi:hypothetical protein
MPSTTIFIPSDLDPNYPIIYVAAENLDNLNDVIFTARAFSRSIVVDAKQISGPPVTVRFLNTESSSTSTIQLEDMAVCEIELQYRQNVDSYVEELQTKLIEKLEQSVAIQDNRASN